MRISNYNYIAILQILHFEAVFGLRPYFGHVCGKKKYLNMLSTSGVFIVKACNVLFSVLSFSDEVISLTRFCGEIGYVMNRVNKFCSLTIVTYCLFYLHKCLKYP